MLKHLIKIQLNQMDWALECGAAVAMFGLFIIPALSYASLPDTIPIHFNAGGKVNGYGTKLVIWILPFTALIVYGSLTIMQQYPHKVNYMIQITAENAQRQYRNMLYMIRLLKLLMLVVLIYIVLTVIQAAQNGTTAIAYWFLPVTLIGVLGLLIFFLIRSYQIK